jgi:hypothetical protein
MDKITFIRDKDGRGLHGAATGSLSKAFQIAWRMGVNLDGACVHGDDVWLDLSCKSMPGLRMRNAYLSGGCHLEADFSTADFDKSTFSSVRFPRVRFDRACLRHCRFEGCYMHRAWFNGADLEGAVFSLCDLRDASFHGADLSGASFTVEDSGYVQGVDFSRANLRGVEWGNVDISQAALGPIMHEFTGMLLGCLEVEIDFLMVFLHSGEYAKEHAAGWPKEVWPEDTWDASLAKAWLGSIAPGATPDTCQVCRITLAWIHRFLKCTGREVPLIF